MRGNRKTALTPRTGRTMAPLGAMIALALAAGIAGSALASEQGEHSRPAAAGEVANPGQNLSMEQVVAKLNDQGFENIYEVEREHGAYEVKARNSAGDMVKIYVDPHTGDVLRHKLDD